MLLIVVIASSKKVKVIGDCYQLMPIILFIVKIELFLINM